MRSSRSSRGAERIASAHEFGRGVYVLVLATPGALAAMDVGTPAPGAPPAAARPYIGPFPPRKRSTGRWWWRHSLWIVWTFSLGLFNWLAFLTSDAGTAGLWLLASLVYLLPIALTVASIGSGYLGLAIGFQLFMSGVSMLHAFVARPRYRAIMFGDPPSGAAPAPPPVLVRALRAGSSPGARRRHCGGDPGRADQVDEIAAVAEAIEKPDVRRKVSLLCRTAERSCWNCATSRARYRWPGPS